MADSIVCQVCGEINPADMEFCRNCQSRLKPLNGALKGESAPIQPGELPTKKVTSELEPLLPQWLRDARQQARDSAAENLSGNRMQEAEPPAGTGPDLLAGLASQKDDEEEDIPDWLAQLTGAQATKKKAVPEESQVKWVELGHGEEPPESLSGQESKHPPAGESPQPVGTERDELTDWFKQAAASSQTADFPLPPTLETPPFSAAPEGTEPQARPSAQPEGFGWLKGMDEDASLPPAPSSAREEAPEWLKKMQADQTAHEAPKPAPETPPPAFRADVPDWLKSLDQEAQAQSQADQTAHEDARPAPEMPPPASGADVPDWLKSLDQEAQVQSQAQATAAEQPAPPATTAPLPDWLKGGGPFSQEQVRTGPKPEEAVTAELPDWMAALGQPPAPAQEASQAGIPAPAAEEPPATTVPDWAAAPATPQAAPQAESEPGPPPSTVEEPSVPAPVTPAETPDWLASLRQEAEPIQAEPEPGATPAELEQPAEQAFADQPVASNDVEAVFASMQAADWLSSVLPSQTETGQGAPSAAQQEEPIAPAELPSWVQAMRPVESAIPAASGPEEGAATERIGPLAGLSGVLPAPLDAVVPTSKPKPQSLKLDANEQQQAHAALLEHILAAETSPIPMKSAGALFRTQKALRWIISALLIIVVGAVVYTRSTLFKLPAGVPNETVGAIQAVEAVAPDAPVLVVFDYQPSTVGEMEASGGSLLDHLLLLKHPKLALLSTLPTGPALAERFMATTLADRAYVRNVQYVDLGYLPGGLAGIYKFAQSPRTTVPLDFDARPAWQSPILLPVEQFSDFAAIIVLTDSTELGRSWIEQTQAARGNSLMVIVSSAQAGPMLLPYFDSGQVNGVISGIYGAVEAERQNNGSPGFVRRYWDAYSVGLYMAVAMIALGALWNLWRGIQEQRLGTGA